MLARPPDINLKFDPRTVGVYRLPAVYNVKNKN